MAGWSTDIKRHPARWKRNRGSEDSALAPSRLAASLLLGAGVLAGVLAFALRPRAAARRKHLAAAVEALPDTVFVADAGGTLHGWHAPGDDQRDAATLADALPAGAAGAIRDASRRAIETHAAQEVEVPGAGGAVLQARISPFGEAEAVGIVRDITGERLAEAERDRDRDRIAQAERLESLGVLAGGIAHDFNNLLVGILGNAQLAITMLDPADEPVRESLEDIVRAGRRASDLTSQMLAYAGRGRFSFELHDLRPLVSAAVDTMAPPPGVAIALALPEQPVEANVDAAQVTRCLGELLRNGVDALNGERGAIAVAVTAELVDARAYPDALRAASFEGGRCAVIEVRDDGEGMSREFIDHVFDPFFTTRFPGRGMGLASLLGVVRAHGGAVSVESERGHGATFRLCFPIAAASAPGAAGAPGHEHRPHTATVLVVDDEPHVRDVTARALGLSGYSVLTAESGSLALDLYREHAAEIDCVVLDLAMPGMDGLQTFDALRALRPDARVLVTTGSGPAEAAARFQGRAPAGFLRKPYVLPELSEAVRDALGTPAEE
ncbi:MAG: response regulator [Dehalococcoidia bacterium]|nr:response regulator [Dehalococcoidia bacterium]